MLILVARLRGAASLSRNAAYALLSEIHSELDDNHEAFILHAGAYHDR
jgi:hypothetical protein